jgi:sugar lactone lactonase YvrE
MNVASIHINSDGREVRCMTSLGNQLYMTSECEIAVYDAATLSFQRSIIIDDINDVSVLHGIASCDLSNCLYVSDCINSVIHRVDPSPEPETRKMNTPSRDVFRMLRLSKKLNWPVRIANCGQPMGLSVNAYGNVLVSCQSKDEILEYDPYGTHKRTIKLQPDVGCPDHVIQLDDDRFVVTRSSANGSLYLGQVFVVDAEGRLVVRFDDRRGLAGGLRQLTANKGGYVFIADVANNRIVVWNPAWQWSCDLPIPQDSGMRRPCAVHLDESCHRLYIGDWRADRLLAVDSALITELSQAYLS